MRIISEINTFYNFYIYYLEHDAINYKAPSLGAQEEKSQLKLFQKLNHHRLLNILHVVGRNKSTFYKYSYHYIIKD